MNIPEPNSPDQDFTGSKELASNKQSKPLQPNTPLEQTIIRDYCQNLEELLN